MNSAVKRTLRLIQSVPEGSPVALLIRHSARDDIPDRDTGIELPLNDLGIRLCQELGRELAGRVRFVRSSPVLRCVQTAKLLGQAADTDGEVILDKRLGAPGAYVLDEQVAWGNWLAHGNEGVIQHLLSGSRALPGMADPAEAANGLIEHLLECAGVEPGLHLFISHDSIVTPTVARAFGQDMPKSQWPEYLDASAFWRQQNGRVMAYRDIVQGGL
ncbi:histidine phosphatase family protein [Thiomonas sp. FB-Cd]|uniref:histidine phosphatase family protein n=1 Tax=Thiomonas sp. FB-Cd TaxID=1158292 RepID=UPI0012DDA811|nr:histidine phosphatase family protein [Thiomonas sp. FB-Cd]